MNTRRQALPLVLIRLKLRLLRNRARSTKGGRLVLVMSCVGGTVVAVFGFSALLAIGHDDLRSGRHVVVIGATALLLGWALFPLLTSGSDESLDPSRLVLFPLPQRSLVRALLVAALVGVVPATVVVSLVGVVVGFGRGGAVIVALAAMALLVLLCAAVARTLSTLLAAGLSSRRGRDATIVIGSLLAVSLQGIRFLHFGSIDAATLDRVSDVLRWLPPGMLGQAVIDARVGHWAEALAELLPALVLLPILLSVWGRALDRSVTVVSDGQSSRRRRKDRLALPLLFRRLPILSPSPWGAVAAKELRYAARHPKRKVQLLNATLFGLAVPIWLGVKATGGAAPHTVLLATFAGYIVVLGAMNQFGLDGGALWMNVAAGNRVRAELLGKNAALAIQVTPVIVVAGVVLAALTGGWVYLPAALLLAAAGLGAGLAVANVVSVRVPIRVPETRSPFAGNGGGQGCVTGLVAFGCAVLQNILLAPVVVATAVAVKYAPVSLVIVVPACVAYGAALWWAGLSVAVGWVWWRQPELLLAVDPARTD